MVADLLLLQALAALSSAGVSRGLDTRLLDTPTSWTFLPLQAGTAASPAVVPAHDAAKSGSVEAVAPPSRARSSPGRAEAPPAQRARSSPGRNAAKAGSVESLQQLLDDGWQPEADRDRRGTSALHLAAGHGFASASALLVDRQTLPVDDTNIERATPLHFAVAGMRSRPAFSDNGFGTGGHADVARALLERGADPSAMTTEGNAVVHWAAWAGGVPVLRLLLEGRAADIDLSVLNDRGCSVAHWAASSGALASCAYLANVHGVDFSVANYEGATPLTKAIYHAKV